MRHNRRAVMAEHYKLYLKKNVFNGKYFVRNMQVVFCALIVGVLLCTVVILSGNKDNNRNTADSNKKINVKEALFGNNEVTEANITATTEAVKAVAGEVNTEEEAIASNIETNEEGAAASGTSEEVIDGIVASEMAPAGVTINNDSDNNDENKAVVNDTIQTADNDNTVGSGNTAGTEETADTTDSKAADNTEKSEFDNRCIANVDETLNVRKEPDADSEFVGSMTKGSIATVEGKEGDWTKIKSGDVEGYVLTEFILTGKVAEAFSKDYVTLQGTALEDGLNIRKERSTESDILKVLDKGDNVSVVEDSEAETDTEKENNTTESVTENTEGKQTEENRTDEIKTEEKASENTQAKDIKWLTVMLDDGQVGYVSEEYVEVEKLYTLAVSAEELQRREEERLAAERAAEEARLAQEQAAERAAQQTASASTSTTSASSNDSGSSSYQGAKTTPVTATASGESLGEFYITAYCGCSKCSGGHNKTASGTTPTQGRTIAADTSVLPFGTQVVIDGVVYTVEDRGSGVCGNHIDIFFATHEDALAFGSKTVTVYKY